MRIFSLFDGISCARVALDRAGIPVEVYFASEIDKYAEQISHKNYPEIRHLGDIKEIQKDVQYSNNQTTFNHLNTRIVRYSDPHSICLTLLKCTDKSF